MKTVPMRLRAALLVLAIGALVACTPGAGGSSAPAASTGTAPSTAPASTAPMPSASLASGKPGY
jgi:hypothetical protein